MYFNNKIKDVSRRSFGSSCTWEAFWMSVWIWFLKFPPFSPFHAYLLRTDLLQYQCEACPGRLCWGWAGLAGVPVTVGCKPPTAVEDEYPYSFSACLHSIIFLAVWIRILSMVEVFFLHPSWKKSRCRRLPVLYIYCICMQTHRRHALIWHRNTMTHRRNTRSLERVWSLSASRRPEWRPRCV